MTTDRSPGGSLCRGLYQRSETIAEGFQEKEEEKFASHGNQTVYTTVSGFHRDSLSWLQWFYFFLFFIDAYYSDLTSVYVLYAGSLRKDRFIRLDFLLRQRVKSFSNQGEAKPDSDAGKNLGFLGGPNRFN